MAETATERARALVDRTRRRAARHRGARAVLAGVAVGTLCAAVLRLLAPSSGPWLWAAALPGIVVAALVRARSRVTRRSAALLLDRVAGTSERFTATTEAGRDEVRELIARQALDAPAVSGGRDPVEYPPSREGLAAALGVFLLVGVLLLAPASSREDGGAPRGPSAPGTASPGAGPRSHGAPDGGAEAPGLTAAARRRAEARLLAGEDLTEEEWRELAAAGLAGETREEVGAALEKGEGVEALRILRKALETAKRTTPAAGPGAGEAGAVPTWSDHRQDRIEPTWAPRHDRVVRRYFEALERAGGR